MPEMDSVTRCSVIHITVTLVVVLHAITLHVAVALALTFNVP